MDVGNLRLFKAMKGQMDWLAQRQKVLAENVANADTPGYKAQELKAIDFREVLRNSKTGVNLTLASTDGSHLRGSKPDQNFPLSRSRNYYEVTPTNNSVSLEDQMLKMSQTADQYKLTVNLYKKFTGFFGMATRGTGGSN